MNAVRPQPEAALVIKWPHSVPVVAAREVSRRLVDARMPATWSLDQTSQVEALASWGAARSGSEAALIVEPADTAPGPDGEQAAGREVGRRLDLLRSTGMSVDVVHAAPNLVAGHWPRTLRALGVQGVVLDDSSGAGQSRALPFGVWQFTPQAVVPRVRKWTNLFRSRPALLPVGAKGPTVISIDLARAGLAGSRSWREMELAVGQVGQASQEGRIGLFTMGQIAARLSQANAPRPQRSILRIAA